MEIEIKTWLYDILSAIKEIELFISTTHDFTSFQSDLKTRRAVGDFRRGQQAELLYLITRTDTWVTIMLVLTYDLPSKIEDNALVFENKERENCNSKIVTRLSFENGLPKQFFLECKEKTGDLYSFRSE